MKQVWNVIRISHNNIKRSSRNKKKIDFIFKILTICKLRVTPKSLFPLCNFGRYRCFFATLVRANEMSRIRVPTIFP